MEQAKASKIQVDLLLPVPRIRRGQPLQFHVEIKFPKDEELLNKIFQHSVLLNLSLSSSHSIRMASSRESQKPNFDRILCVNQDTQIKRDRIQQYQMMCPFRLAIPDQFIPASFKYQSDGGAAQTSYTLVARMFTCTSKLEAENVKQQQQQNKQRRFKTNTLSVIQEEKFFNELNNFLGISKKYEVIVQEFAEDMQCTDKPIIDVDEYVSKYCCFAAKKQSRQLQVRFTKPIFYFKDQYISGKFQYNLSSNDLDSSIIGGIKKHNLLQPKVVLAELVFQLSESTKMGMRQLQVIKFGNPIPINWESQSIVKFKIPISSFFQNHLYDYNLAVSTCSFYFTAKWYIQWTFRFFAGPDCVRKTEIWMQNDERHSQQEQQFELKQSFQRQKIKKQKLMKRNRLSTIQIAAEKNELDKFLRNYHSRTGSYSLVQDIDEESKAQPSKRNQISNQKFLRSDAASSSNLQSENSFQDGVSEDSKRASYTKVSNIKNQQEKPLLLNE